MRIVWLSWKDINHPEAGGAEIVSDSLRKHLVKSGHTIKLVTARYADTPANETVDGIEINRVGNRYTVYTKAAKFYRKNYREWPDLVIDEMNTVPFFAAFYSRKPSVLLTYQLARQVWFYQMVFPISLVGYLLEPLYVRLLSKKYAVTATESESTKNELVTHGFKKSTVEVFRVGMKLKAVAKLSPKHDFKTILFFGALRPMKQPLEAIKAFEFARDKDSALNLKVAGSTTGNYAKKVQEYVAKSRHADAITLLGRVSDEAKAALMQEASLILVTSIKEGWGLIVTEANSQGTPAIAYDTDGLRDSVVNNKTGLLVTAKRPDLMGNAICQLLGNASKYSQMRANAHAHSKQFTFKNSYEDFIKIIEGQNEEKKD